MALIPWRVLIHTEKHKELQGTLNEQEESEKKIEEHREREIERKDIFLIEKKTGKCIYQNLITFEIYHHIYRYNHCCNRIDTIQDIRLRSRLKSRKHQLSHNWFSRHINWLLNGLKMTPFGLMKERHEIHNTTNGAYH